MGRKNNPYALESRLVVIPNHDDVIKWKHFPRYWPFVRGIPRSRVNSPHKGQWRGAFMSSLICAWINLWVNNREAGDLRRYRAHYDVIVMIILTVRACRVWCVFMPLRSPICIVFTVLHMRLPISFRVTSLELGKSRDCGAIAWLPQHKWINTGGYGYLTVWRIQNW